MNLDKLVNRLGFNRLKFNEPLSAHVNMKVGGSADIFYEAKNSKELKEAVLTCIEEKIPFTVLGNGANVLVSDKGVRGMVIKNSSQQVKFLPFGFVEADSGVDLTQLITEAKNRSLLGLERMIKVPGTVGGAVYMNAGDTGKSRFFGDLIVSVEVVGQDGKVKKLSRQDCDFGYRSSRFQRSGEVILKAKIQLKQASRAEIEEEAKDILIRKMHHPAGATIGSTFKNPPGYFAGRLIEECGLKGKQIGGAKISERHANFIINTGNAKAAEVKALIDLIKQSVKEKFGVELEEEVRYIGEW